MEANRFDYARFQDFSAEKQETMAAFLSDKTHPPLVMQLGSSRHWGSMSQNRYDSLSEQLDYFTRTMALDTDAVYGYLEPWHGTGVFAAAFGCETILFPGLDAQVRHLLPDMDALETRPAANIDCPEFLQVLDTIRYFQEQTKGRIPISVTDTQSPNDIGSLVMDSVEFIASCLEEPERLAPFLDEITDLVIRFTEKQMAVIGKDLLALPGHVMPSGLVGFRGVTIADDNMAFVSTGVYRDTFLPYNSRIGAHFGGISIHSCGKIAHNIPLLLQTKNLEGIDLAVGYDTDPCPNNAADLAPLLAGSGVLVKARFGPDELENLRPLVRPDIKLIAQYVFNNKHASDDAETRNRYVAEGRHRIADMYKEACDRR